MSVLNYYNHEVKTEPEIKDDFLLVNKTEKDGKQITVPEKVDYENIQKSLGKVGVWKYEALMNAGVNPKTLKIHTTDPSKSEGYDRIDKVIDDLPEVKNEKKTN